MPPLSVVALGAAALRSVHRWPLTCSWFSLNCLLASAQSHIPLQPRIGLSQFDLLVYDASSDALSSGRMRAGDVLRGRLAPLAVVRLTVYLSGDRTSQLSSLHACGLLALPCIHRLDPSTYAGNKPRQTELPIEFI